MRPLIHHAKQLKGTLTIPGDKSISHRSIMLGAIAEGKTRITGFLRAEDCLSTIQVMRQLGATIHDDGEKIVVEGKGMNGLTAPSELLDVGNSGTTIRLLAGLLAGQPFKSVLAGDQYLNKRPMQRVITPLSQMGAKLHGHEGTELPPLTIEPVDHLQAIRYEMPVASAQVKSAIILAGLQAEGETVVIEKERSRNHTEEMLQQFGGQIDVNGKEIRLKGGQTLKGQTIEVPGDISSAAFFLVAGLIVPNSDLLLKNVGINETRSGIIDVIKDMGGNITISMRPNGISADIRVQTSQLKATTINGEMIPRLIDEIPIIALLATQAEGDTVIEDAEELKVKETDRIHAVASQLNKMNAHINETEDGMIIHGGSSLQGAEVDSFGDHRIGMMLQVAALLTQSEVHMKDADCVNISYPTFFDEIARLVQA
ncbi:3-phosphoshikimate 1-carboxyvinyltransferase [Jeotgalibaca arthritidis]|jgi:3-phosphoshikimate 1-carboxyvinyltransferase|uniref:3-phosphoshikimate 1-carboxyvinyltransferase n=2 Tax=Jeotgalibaca TaxID=1470540 RepID=A0A6G7K788_9LACT|nr:3-phosphoshikimate 1-carboxyvinyltransferase [Jeotgalibaca arthritidis]QII81123.1 3-phosphoshikimate 1-carboxyvinyltransferase [Jeotgalibaca arthritidis]